MLEPVQDRGKLVQGDEGADDGHAAEADWDRFRWLSRTAAGAGEADRLTEALAPVRGEPLGAPSSGWAWSVPHITEMVCAIGDVAHRLAQLRLEALDLPRATAAARAGLRGVPWDQRLYCDLMEAADAAGNPAGVDAVYHELVRLLEELDNDQPHSDVEAIYRRCRARQIRAT